MTRPHLYIVIVYLVYAYRTDPRPLEDETRAIERNQRLLSRARPAMASTVEGGNPAHKMKRTGRALWKRNTLGVASSSSPAGNRTESQAGDVDDVPIPVAVNDILPPAGSYPSAPPIETPVPLPVPMRTPTSTASTLGPTAKQKPLAANKNILQAQRDWEKKQTSVENQGEQCGSWRLRCLRLRLRLLGAQGRETRAVTG